MISKQKAKVTPDYTCACGSTRKWLIWDNCIICTNDGCDKVYELNILHPAIFNKTRDELEIK